MKENAKECNSKGREQSAAAIAIAAAIIADDTL